MAGKEEKRGPSHRAPVNPNPKPRKQDPLQKPSQNPKEEKECLLMKNMDHKKKSHTRSRHSMKGNSMVREENVNLNGGPKDLGRE